MNVKRFWTLHKEESTEGDCVRYSDYERLLTQHAKQAAELARLRRAAAEARGVLIALDTMSRNNREQMVAESIDAIEAALAASEVK